jgi:hypothetical protein
MTQTLKVSDNYDQRNWLHRATIIFIYIHPKIGAKNAAETAAFTGMKENTLLTRKKLLMGG